MRFFSNKKGVSPVTATLILVGVALSVAVAVSYWIATIAALKDVAIIYVTVALMVSVVILLLLKKRQYTLQKPNT
jgi:flagellin-like protein